jgi:hypothetical protein
MGTTTVFKSASVNGFFNIEASLTHMPGTIVPLLGVLAMGSPKSAWDHGRFNLGLFFLAGLIWRGSETLFDGRLSSWTTNRGHFLSCTTHEILSGSMMLYIDPLPGFVRRQSLCSVVVTGRALNAGAVFPIWPCESLVLDISRAR